MLYKNLKLAVLLTSVTSFASQAQIDVSGKFIHESANFMGNGTTIGAANAHGADDQFKSESSLRVILDGTADKLNEGATYHVE